MDSKKTEELQDYFNNDEAAMEIAKEIFNHIELKLEDEDSLTPHAIASLASSALTAQKLFKNVTLYQSQLLWTLKAFREL